MYMYDKLVSKVDDLESKIASTIGFIYKSQYDIGNTI